MTLVELLTRNAEKIQSVLPKSLSCKPIITGYGEKRDIYIQPQYGNRCIHLGIDTPLPAGTKIVCPLNARVHSFADNQRDGDYGPTVILQHELDQHIFYSLYGHLSRTDLPTWHEGQPFAQGAVIGHIGASSENGGWPPHLHLQLIDQIGQYQGDYPGVCRPEEAEHYLNNCPNPEGLIIAS